jgi:hypothetical protein
VLANYQQTKIGQPNLGEPIGFDQFPDGRIIQTDRRGGIHLHDLATGTSRVISTIPVYNQSEDGMYGGAVDNDFATNHWVYLYYAPPNVDNITYSDGTTGHTNNFDAASGRSNAAAPTQAVNISDFDSWIGYFQLSRFKFVDDVPGGDPAHLDLASGSRSCASRSTAAPVARGRRYRLRQARQSLPADRRRLSRGLGRRRPLRSEHRPAHRREPDRPRTRRRRSR